MGTSDVLVQDDDDNTPLHLTKDPRIARKLYIPPPHPLFCAQNSSLDPISLTSRFIALHSRFKSTCKHGHPTGLDLASRCRSACDCHHGCCITWLSSVYSVTRTTAEDSDGSDEERGLNDVAKTLQTEMFLRWIKEGVFVDEAYKLLKLDQEIFFLDSPEFASLIKYVDMFNKMNPGNKLSIYEGLERRFDDANVIEFIKGALANPRTKSIGERLQTDMLQSWLRQGRSQKAVAHTLLTADGNPNVFRKRYWGGWLTYVDDFNARYPAQKHSVGAVLRAACLGLTPWDIVDYKGFSTWAKYVKLVSKKDPEATMIAVLRNHFSKERLTKLLEESKARPETEALATALLR
ncbi:unnamed protein product [Phytophthora lilii]|uniref:Unnamed protein product n=1 Tax=Phytophthora lilii TaxID=2077276 RepID=A0A9W6WMU9_9STRA|nr:unnamed protein product [Phytophthora lilii]